MSPRFTVTSPSFMLPFHRETLPILQHMPYASPQVALWATSGSPRKTSETSETSESPEMVLLSQCPPVGGALTSGSMDTFSVGPLNPDGKTAAYLLLDSKPSASLARNILLHRTRSRSRWTSLTSSTRPSMERGSSTDNVRSTPAGGLRRSASVVGSNPMPPPTSRPSLPDGAWATPEPLPFCLRMSGPHVTPA